MRLTGIVAMTPERLIGQNGDLPWRIPEDLKFFKKQTSGHPIVMGRKTFESIGRPLPKRQNIVLTSDPAWNFEGVEAIHHPCDLNEISLINQQIYIIGGAQVYQLLLPKMDDLIITHIKKSYQGDTFFPEYQQEFPQHELLLEEQEFTVRRHFRETQD